MAHSYVFADEAGDFVFKRKDGASRYFILCTIATTDCHLSNDLLALRRDIAMNGEPERDKLHATADKQDLRDRVFALLAKSHMRIDATLLEKSKALPKVRATEATFYRYAWYYHFKHVGPLLTAVHKRLLITAAALGTKKTRAAFKEGLNNTIQQITPRNCWEASFHDSSKDPYLWVADYCAWAIQRKWERNDLRSYNLISSKIRSEFDLWRFGTHHYY